MNVPFVDLKAQYLAIQKDIDQAVQNVINDTAFIKGKYVEAFEINFARTIGTDFCVGVGNGTDALHVAMRALGIGKGDEVITAANSFIATSEAIAMTGARVVFIDIDPQTYTIDVSQIEDKITSRTKGIIPVHLYGQPADMDPICEMAQKYRLSVIEDAAQAHLAEYKGKTVGSIGNAGCFSFYPSKNLGAYGDAGAVVTDDEKLAEKIRKIANHGRIGKYDHEFEGLSSRMDGLQGAILNSKLKYLPEWTERRRHVASLYNSMLEECTQVIRPKESDFAKHVYHLYVVRVTERDRLREYLNSLNIATGIHYPIALPNLRAYGYLGYSRTDIPVSTQFQNEILSLPMYPELKESQIGYVVDCIREFF